MTKPKDPLRVTTLTRIWRSIRRWWSRSEWAVWLLGLSRDSASPFERGLIIVQVDGLSRGQLEKAMAEGRMPFLSSLLKDEGYVNHLLYSGLPSSTPAVQGELFYGVRSVVPGFGFRDHESGQLVRMFASDIATRVESKLAARATGLLEGGSSYANIYGGGANDVYFCATSFGRSEQLQKTSLIRSLVLALIYVFLFVRITFLMAVEAVLATLGFVKGVFSGREFWQELLMIPARVLVVVLLRELVTIGTCFDAARGQPIVHVNLLGYDEQAHRRGPASRYAHWTLRGIDRCIRRIWRAAHLGAGRDYDVWVMSDHGQEATVPWQREHGQSIQQRIAELAEARTSSSNDFQAGTQRRERVPSRANWVGMGRFVKLLFGEQDDDMQARSSRVQTVTSGPVGFVYFLDDELKKERHAFAQQLVDEENVPMAIVADDGPAEEGGATLYRDGQAWRLPKNYREALGRDHPFSQVLGDDLVRLARHPDAGDIFLVGWSPTREHVSSFVLQNGAHAGPGIEETSAFALLPPDVRPVTTPGGVLRPNGLRETALQFLGRAAGGIVPSEPGSTPSRPLQVMTYNVHGCVGMDGLLFPDRIARVIAQSGADIVCLQELDVLRARSGHIDQAATIAGLLEMHYQFHAAWNWENESFGNAILSRYPMKLIRETGLHHHKADRSRRSALWVELCLENGTTLQVINTHLSIYPREQQLQAAELERDWIRPALQAGPVVVCGDLNARPQSRTCATIQMALNNVRDAESGRPQATYFSPRPVTRFDHIFVSRDLDVKRVQAVRSQLARLASDHLPLMAEIEVADGQRS